MGSYRSKKDDVAKIATSIYITNFPETISAKELFNSCKIYGHVMDSFIPNKIAKNGKRFGFVWFINVFNVDRLVSNLCTVWIDRHKLQANIARFIRNTVKGSYAGGKANVGFRDNNMKAKNNVVEKVIAKSIYHNAGLGSSYGCIFGFPIDKKDCMGGGVNKQNSNISDDDNDVERISETVLPVDDQKDVNKEEGGIDQKQENVNKEEENYDEKNILAGGESVNMADPADRVGSYRNCKILKNTDESGDNSISSGHFKNSELPHTGGSILGVLEEVIKVGTVMGYKMEGCMSNIAEIIKAEGVEEGEMVSYELGPSYGVVYVPHDIKEKYMLWDYLHCEIDRWKGQVVIMGDNEVRVKSDRYGLVFNARGAKRFNSFISDSGLVEINLGGSISLDRYLSDYRLILLGERYVDYGPTPLKKFHYWLDIEGFNKIVKDAWKSHAIKDDNAIRYIMGKFKFVKSKIWEWNASYKNEAKKDKDQCICDLVNIDNIIDNGNRGEEEVLRRVEIVNKIQKIDGLLAKELAQKTKIKWAIEGDENSKFFHESQLRGLECEVSNDEIKKAVWDCGTKKAMGPDGFTFGFFWHFWYLIHNEVYDAVSLIGSIYKIIAKILANRLVGVLDDIVNEVQLAFITDRQILNGTFILNEVIQWCKVKNKQALIFKVYFEKAYDSVRWDFLDEVLRKFSFGDKWFKWIQCCLNSLRGLILVNGSPTKEFQFGKGLKQGDPLSPFLFILIIESLHLSFQRIMDEGGNMSRMHVWNETVDKVKKRLSKWKMNTLSIGGRLTLIKSPLFNGHDIKSKKATWVNWKKALVAKDRGGLGILSLYAMNRESLEVAASWTSLPGEFASTPFYAQPVIEEWKRLLICSFHVW
nr:RNA-directed DNA polymerase, eukaryota [Tanacetum cinerariifolium]